MRDRIVEKNFAPGTSYATSVGGSDFRLKEAGVLLFLCTMVFGTPSLPPEFGILVVGPGNSRLKV